MKHNDLKKCLNLAEVMCETLNIDTDNVDVCLVSSQIMNAVFDCQGAKIEISIKPKGTDNGKN